jgi:hypothetical protein
MHITSTHNPPIMALTLLPLRQMLPRLRQLVLGAGPVAMAKAIPSAPTPGAVIGVPALVTKKAKALNESALAMLDESAVR